MLAHAVQVGTRFRARNYRRGRLLWEVEGHNLVVTLGCNLLLDQTFSAAASAVTWYLGLKATGTVVAGDTMASHAGWAEISTEYSQATRPAWVKNAAASAGTITNSASQARFDITTGVTVYGALLANDATKGGSSGLLYGAGDFAAPRALVTSDVLFLLCEMTVAPA